MTSELKRKYTVEWQPLPDVDRLVFNTEVPVTEVVVNGKVYSQPKTTSTDIEELKKEFEERVIGETFAGGIFNDNDNQRMYTSGYADGFRSAKSISWRWFEPHLSNKSELKREAVEQLKGIDGFVGFNVDGGGVWYGLFDVETDFWKFLNRNARSSSIEPPLYPVGRYSYRESTEMGELVNWLLEEHKTYLSTNEKNSKSLDKGEDEPIRKH